MKRLKELRKSRKLSQVQVANEIFTSQQNYSRYESGATEPDYDTLKKLAIFFDVSIDYLLGLIDEPIPLKRESQKVTPPPSNNSITLNSTDKEAIKRTAELLDEILKLKI